MNISVCGLSSYFLDIVFERANVFTFNDLQFVSYFFHGLCLWWCYLKVITIPRSSRFSPTLHSGILWLAVPHLSLILFEWIFINAVGLCLDWLFFACWCSPPFVEDHFFSTVLPLLLCHKSVNYIYSCRPFLKFPVLFH